MAITRTSPIVTGSSMNELPTTITLDDVYQHIAEHGDSHRCATCTHIEYIADSADPHHCTLHNHPVNICTPACSSHTTITHP